METNFSETQDDVMDILNSVFPTSISAESSRKEGRTAGTKRTPKNDFTIVHRDRVLVMLHGNCGVTQQEITQATGWDVAKTKAFMLIAQKVHNIEVIIEKKFRNGVNTITYSVTEQFKRSA